MYKEITRKNIRKLLQLSLNDAYFKCNGESYQQLEDLLMSTIPSLIIAKIYVNNFKMRSKAECQSIFKNQFHRSYLDGTFIILRNENQAESFLNFINN